MSQSEWVGERELVGGLVDELVSGWDLEVGW